MKALSVSLAVMMSAGVAFAGLQGPALTVTASADGRTATWTLPQSAGTWDAAGTWTWVSSPGWSVNMVAADGTNIASLGNPDSTPGAAPWRITFRSNPVIDVNFTAVAGAAPTTFTFASGLLTFPTFVNPIASASAGISVSDRDGNGATLAGSFDGRAYRADFNGLVPTGTTYARFIDGFSVSSFGTEVRADFRNTPIAGTVSSMSAAFNFTLSALDSVSGTSAYQIIPTPAGLAVLGLFGLAAIRRRR